MARDVLEIWNQALSYVGSRAAVQDLTEDSREAQHLNSVWGLIRDSELEGPVGFDWNFLTAYRSLAALDLGDDLPASWAYAYQYPSDCMRFRFIEGTSRSEEDPLAYEIGSWSNKRVIYTDMEDAVGCYTRFVTDPNLWSAKFCVALAWKLAASLAMTEIGTVGDAAAMEKVYSAEIGRAMAQSANEEQRDAQRTSAGIRSRE